MRPRTTTARCSLVGLLVLKAKRNLINKKLEAENAPPLVVDSQLNKWPASELIGNGSMVIAKIHFYGWNRAKEGVGLSAELHGIQVVKHVPYSTEELGRWFFQGCRWRCCTAG